MYIKVTKSGDRRYIQLAESYRDSEGRSRQRIIANLGRLDDSTSQANSILAALLQASGQQTGEGNEARLLSTYMDAPVLPNLQSLIVGRERLQPYIRTFCVAERHCP